MYSMLAWVICTHHTFSYCECMMSPRLCEIAQSSWGNMGNVKCPIAEVLQEKRKNSCCSMCFQFWWGNSIFFFFCLMFDWLIYWLLWDVGWMERSILRFTLLHILRKTRVYFLLFVCFFLKRKKKSTNLKNFTNAHNNKRPMHARRYSHDDWTLTIALCSHKSAAVWHKSNTKQREHLWSDRHEDATHLSFLVNRSVYILDWNHMSCDFLIFTEH